VGEARPEELGYLSKGATLRRGGMEEETLGRTKESSIELQSTALPQRNLPMRRNVMAGGKSPKKS